MLVRNDKKQERAFELLEKSPKEQMSDYSLRKKGSITLCMQIPKKNASLARNIINKMEGLSRSRKNFSSPGIHHDFSFVDARSIQF